MYFTLSAGFVSHLLLFICLLKDPLKCFRNSATYLIANLALSDFITCSAGLLIRMTWKISITIFYVWNTAMLVSLLSIFSIAIDRYVLKVHPFKHRILLNGRRIAVWIVSIWLLSSWLLVKDLAFGISQTDMHIYDTIFIVIPLVTGLIIKPVTKL
jgi:prolactin releasing hormone receptor